MIPELSELTISELQALVEQGMPIEAYEAELKRREAEQEATNGTQHR